MEFIEQTAPKKRSLGALRKATKTKPRSPDLTGKMRFQRHTIAAIAKELTETNKDEVVCHMAGWSNHDDNGAYLTVEVSPRYQRPTSPSLVDMIFGEQETRH
jgi:hypothetical protein